jgi:hypothetical protein
VRRTNPGWIGEEIRGFQHLWRLAREKRLGKEGGRGNETVQKIKVKKRRIITEF